MLHFDCREGIIDKSVSQINMKNNIVHLFIMLTIGFSSSLFSQSQYLEEKLLSWLESNSRDELLSRIENLKSTSPQSATPFYIEALLQEDANQALFLYKKIIQNFPHTVFAEYSQLKLAQYYFMTESYDVARQLLDNLITRHPKSDILPTAKYLAALCLVAAKKNAQAIKELDWYAKQYSQTSLGLLAEEEIERLSAHTEQEKDVLKMTVSHEQRPSLSARQRFENYTVQVGAFGSRENAERQQQFYQGQGFKARLETKYINGRLLHLIWIEDFETIDEAQNFGKLLNQRFGTPFRIVKK